MISYDSKKVDMRHRFKYPFGKCALRRKIRFFLQDLKGAYVLYMLDHEEKVIGYTYFECGAGGRYPWATSQDWIISPYEIDYMERGKGYGLSLLEESISFFRNNMQGNLYAEVRENNIPSIKIFEKSDFERLTHAINCGGLFRNYKENIDGDYVVYRLKRKTDNKEGKHTNGV